MSIKDLFGKSTNYVSDTNQKDAFSDAESSRNVKAISEKQSTFEPQIDYSDPQTFAKYGSAQMYYQSAIDRIIDFYPYDGSDAEYNEFYNKSLDIEKFIFNDLYPRTTGYVNFDGSSFITFEGGPHTLPSSDTKSLFKDPSSSQRETANIYDEDIYTTAGLPTDYGDGTRESNLKCDFDKGVTLEFWVKSDTLSTQKQTLFYLTNSVGGDKLSVFLDGTVGSGSPFKTTLFNDGLLNFEDEIIGSTPTKTSITDWVHYAISFKNGDGGGIRTRFYVNGKLDEDKELGTALNSTLLQKGTIASLASGSYTDSHNHFNGSMDEFRFWKTERAAQNIGRNWFGQVRGGSNKDISNTTLGVYYKFNEGIVGDSEKDKIVLDYSGRISNGTITGYGSTTRNTGSAIVSSSASTREYLDPIIYGEHPDVSALRSRLIETGSFYDSTNNASIASMIPSWVLDQHEEKGNNNFKYLTHIVGAYFDKIRLQIEALPTFKSPIYTSSSYKPLPFANKLPASLGLETSDLFVDSSVLEKFLNRSETENYEFDLDETKNLIYLNLYNNLAYIFKSKGTHKSIKSVLQTFDIDDKLVRLNTYANNFVYDLENNLRQTKILDSVVNFNDGGNLDAVVYSTASANDTQLGYILSSNTDKHEDRYGLTLETDIVFPKFARFTDTFDRNFLTASLFGIHSASVDVISDTTIGEPSIYVFAEREELYSKNIRFRLSSSLLSTTLTSSNFLGVYNDNQWNLSVRLQPASFGLTGSVAGISGSNYTLKFTGYNQLLGEIRESFTITGSVINSAAQNLLSSPKRVFVGAQRENVTGSLINKTDVMVSAMRLWAKSLDDETLKQHAYDFENYGIKDANKHLSPIDADNSKTLNSHTLVLNYDFSGITSSDSSGEFIVTDISSGSTDAINGEFGKIGEISGYLYPGKGQFFATSSVDAVIKKETNLHQFINPELVIKDNLVQIKTDDDKLFDTLDTIPNYHYLLEKSMYNAISEEMLNFFAGVVDFHNLIGHPVHQYRMNYKGLEKLRETFFRRVTDVTEVERFIDYYKWFDDSVSQIIGQLVPASADYTPDILNTVESHVLERNKYQHRIPMTEFTSSTEGVAFGAEELRYNWNKNHAPISGLEQQNSNWWKERAEREGTISSGDSTIDSQREKIRSVTTNQTNGGVGRSFKTDGTRYARSNFKYRTLSRGNVFESKITREIKGGVNFEDNKDIHYTYTALHPAGPVNHDDNVFVPRNVLLGFTEDLVQLQDSTDDPDVPSAKIKRNILIQHGRDWEGGFGYKNTKSAFAFPFNIISSSVRSGYNAEVVSRVTASIEVTNLHNDVYGPDMERPMQGTFTEYAVGGHQSRHIKLNDGNDDYLNRPEAWKIALGKCPNTDGAIGMVGADYPYPEANAEGENPYPMTGAQKAVYFRDELAKRPVNIRNIHHKTGSTILGNYNENYDVVHTVGGYSNPRAFIDEQPILPTKAGGADVVKTILDLERGKNGHFTFIDDYNAGYLTGSGNYKNKTVIVSRFSAPGSFESMTPAFKDFRSGDFSAYNTTPFRNMTVRRPFQGVTSSIISQTTGIRGSDHTGRDFGFTNLAARHATRFFRDSYVESDTDFANVPRNTPDLNSPGKADNAFTEAPSFHKVHRNNVIEPREIVTTTPITYQNENSLRFTNTTDAKSLSTSNFDLTSRAMTLSFWIYDDKTTNIVKHIFSLNVPTGSLDNEFSPLQVSLTNNSPNSQIALAISDADESSKTNDRRWLSADTVTKDQWNHIFIRWDGDSSTKPEIFINNTASNSTQIGSFSDPINISYSSIHRHAIGRGTVWNPGTNNQGRDFLIDEFGFWNGELSDANKDSLYNSGSYYDIDRDPDSVKSSDMYFYLRMGDATGDAAAGNLSDGDTIVDIGDNSNNFIAAVSDAGQLQITASTFDTFSETVINTSTEIVCDQKYDNLNLYHQIPRSDRQYSWIAHSITHTGTCEPRYSGFMQVNSEFAPYYEITGNYYPFFDYVTASATGFIGFSTSDVYQNTTRLNLLTLDPTASQTNTLGTTDLTEVIALGYAGPGLPGRFNALMLRRGDTYGWNWRALHQKDHPILHREHKENLLTAVKNKEIKQFRLPPVSMKGKPVMVNIDAGNQNVTLKATHNNERIYFNERELNDLVFQTEDQTITPFDQLMDKGRDYNLNWVRYSETLFPSTRNEFSSGSRERIGYDNKFWRGNIISRVELGKTLGNSVGVLRDGRYNRPYGIEGYALLRAAEIAAYGIDPGASSSVQVSHVQSAWPLDAEPTFLTRTEARSSSLTFSSFNDNTDSDLIRKAKNSSNLMSVNSGSGELQNYYMYNQVNGPSRPRYPQAAYGFGAILSRKHHLTSPNSVVARSGFAETGSMSSSFTEQVPIFGGEALWEAGTHATINVVSGNLVTTSSYPSEPWFDEYGDFREELQLVARDYSIIPEFRISERIKDYVKQGIFNRTDFKMLNIPGSSTQISKSVKYDGVRPEQTFGKILTIDTTGEFDSSMNDFYKDYSNSDFLKEFSSIKDKSGLNPKEIMLTCKAAIRFNPYKGFYPAQRTLDLVGQFSDSFSEGMRSNSPLLAGSSDYPNNLNGSRYINSLGGSFLPVAKPLFAPGILYNSIKSGIAVDYPVVNNNAKISYFNFTGSNSGARNDMLIPPSGSHIDVNGYNPNNQYWDLRVPFEAIIEPSKYIDKTEFLDFEPHPSASINSTASLDTSVSDGIYELMAKNFFGQTGDFFLKNSSYTKIESDLIQDGLKFNSGDIFAARLKIRRSHNGQRFYNLESGSNGDNTYFTADGAQAYSGSFNGDLEQKLSGSYPLPQDPSHRKDFRETFTMYSRPTAFGPAVSGRNSHSDESHEDAFSKGTLDSLEGYNWAYTPPYYHGESWVDFIFRPESGKEYTLEDVLSETQAVFWRIDPGQISGSTPAALVNLYKNQRLLIDHGYDASSALSGEQAVYGGSVVNRNAMQLSSSLNLFGVERVPKKRKDKFGNTILDQNELAGKRWVIQPKWETPMLNFANVTSSNNNITYPTNFSESVPRGIWHQFGEIPTDSKTGVFLEIGDIPKDWLKYHYDVINFDSVYNNYSQDASGSSAYLDYQSLTDLFGFSRSQKKDSAKVRLGEIADKKEVYEAVVAIPYIVEANEDYTGEQNKDAINRKKFISIPKQRLEAALAEREGSRDGDSLETSGESIRKMVQKMKRYIMPPQFDFINFDQIDPIVMYFFEFKYEFDKDDLSYIWQNLAPRDYKKITFQEASVAHDLMNTELLEEQNIIDNPNLRWMVFKVKQKATKDYYDLIPPQIKAARPTSNLDKPETDKDDEYLQFNWPYDYLSFVELVKLEADVLYKAEDEEEPQ